MCTEWFGYKEVQYRWYFLSEIRYSEAQIQNHKSPEYKMENAIEMTKQSITYQKMGLRLPLMRYSFLSYVEENQALD